MSKSTRLETPEICPVCSQEVPARALACPECGADHQSGWRDDAGVHDGLDLVDEEFDYEEFARKEFGSAIKPRGIKTVWWLTALCLLVALILVYFWPR